MLLSHSQLIGSACFLKRVIKRHKGNEKTAEFSETRNARDKLGKLFP